MGRPRKTRQVKSPPFITFFKPAAIPVIDLEEVVLTLGEYEAIRLSDYKGLSHGESAEYMEISRPTFTRLIESAHKKISIAFVEAKAVRIEGGNYEINNNLFLCQNCGHRWEGLEHPEACPECNSDNITCLGEKFGMCRRNRCRRGRR